MVLPYVPMQITKWTTAEARGKMQTLKEAHSWADKTEGHFTWSYRPSLGTNWEQQLVEHKPGASPARLHAALALRISFEHPGRSPSTALHPIETIIF